MKVIAELIDYFAERGALSSAQVLQLAKLGFVDWPKSYDFPERYEPDDDEPELHPEPAQPRRRKRKGGPSKPAGNLTEIKLAAWLRRNRPAWSDPLSGMVALAQRMFVSATLDDMPMILRNADHASLEAAVRESIATRAPAIDRLWEAMSLGGYREIGETAQGPVANAYRAILRSEEHTERGKHAWLLKSAQVRWVYNLVRAQRRLVAICGELHREDPELLRRAICRDYQPIAWLAVLILYNAPRRKPALRFNLDGHAGAVRGVATAEDGKGLVSCGDDGTVRAWDLAVRTNMVLARGGAAMDCVAISPKERIVAAGDRNGGITIRSVDGSSEACSWIGNSGSIRALAFDASGEILASAGAHGVVHLWNPITHDLTAVFGGHPHPVLRLAYSAESDFLASIDNARVILWPGDLHRPLRDILPQGGPRGMAFHPDGKRIAVCADSTISIFSIPECEREAIREDLEDCLCIAWSPRGNAIAIGTKRGILLFDETLTLTAELGFHRHVGFVEFTANGLAIVAVAENGEWFVWNPEDQIHKIKIVEQVQGLTTTGYSREHGLLARVGYSGWIRIWQIPPDAAPCLVHTWRRSGAPVSALAFDPEGKSVYAATGDGEIRACDLDTKAVRAIAKDPDFPIKCLAFNNAGNLVAGGAGPQAIGVLRSLDAKTGTVVRRQCGHPGDILALAFHPHKPILMNGGEAGFIYVWDIKKKSCVAMIQGAGTIRSLSVQPEGNLLAAASGPGVHMFQLPELTHGEYLSQRGGDAWSVAWLSHEILAGGGEDGVIRLWSARDAAEIGSLAGHPGPVRALARTHDGRTVSSAGVDSRIRVWDARDGMRAPREVSPEIERLQDADWTQWITAWEHALLMDADHVPAYLAMLSACCPAAFSAKNFVALGAHLWNMPFFRPRKWNPSQWQNNPTD